MSLLPVEPAIAKVGDRAECADDASSGWRAALRLRLEPGPGRTRVRRLSGFGPLYLQKPFFPEGTPAHLYLLHPPGGFVGGDRLEIDLQVATGAAGLVTTPSASKFYRSVGPRVELTQRLTVASGAELEWLPQESLFFSGSQARIETEVRVAPSGRFIGWEIGTLGRPASGDHFDAGEVTSRLTVLRVEPVADDASGDAGAPDGAAPRSATHASATGVDPAGRGLPLLIEQNRWRAGDALLSAPWGMAGRSVTGLFVALPADRDVLERVRQGLAALQPAPEVIGGVTLLHDLLVARVLAFHNEIARGWLEQVWRLARPLVLGRPPCTPRVWHT